MDHIGTTEAELFDVRYVGNTFDQITSDFHAFPEASGWSLNEKCEFKPQRSNPTKFEKFLQSWLFFGLLHTIIYLGPGKSVEFSRFHGRGQKSDWITTESLSEYLKGWEAQEVEDRENQTIRMIRAQIVLDKARRVVRQYCSLDEASKAPNAGNMFQVGDNIALSLMVLGETLAVAKAKIVERVGFSVRGWHGDATQGWGTPKIIIERMENEHGPWCPKTVHMLRGQMKSHATALLVAYTSHLDSLPRMSRGHQGCTKELCKRKAEDSEGEYETKHVKSGEHDCEMIGPEIDDVVKAIDNDKIPLLYFSDTEDGLKVRVRQMDPHNFHEYATISHVWADGYGNENDNKLRKCQLEYFRGLFRKAQAKSKDSEETDSKEIDFWIDTLAIPVQKEHKEKRKKAIRQIYEVYTRAKYTIVIDNGLREMASGHSYGRIAMRILASGWMQRLWTLQEAYLSDHIFFAFKPEYLVELDAIEKRFPSADQDLESNVPEAARNYFHSLLGQERKERIHNLRPNRTIHLVASLWRAAQWRTTAHPEHEVLALATLLRLVNGKTSFADAGLLPKQQPQQNAVLKDSRLEEMMKELWILLEEVYPGSIPSGIIFLPGNKLTLDGFKWAPQTWMVGQGSDEPDPLNSLRSPARMEADLGLYVRYPGFLLHATDPKGMIVRKDKFSFPTDNTLSEWYTAVRADVGEREQPLFNQDRSELAIILARERPREIPEIALLVEIVRRSPPREFEAHQTPTTYHVLIITRLRIQRERSILHDYNFITGPPGQEDKIICGEILDNDQEWYVGGSRYSKRSDTAKTASGSDQSPGDPPDAFQPRRMPEKNNNETQIAPAPEGGRRLLKRLETWSESLVRRNKD